jgi:hypothetical protein
MTFISANHQLFFDFLSIMFVSELFSLNWLIIVLFVDNISSSIRTGSESVCENPIREVHLC